MVNNEGNAEIMGVVLLIAIFVAAVALMGVTMFSAPQPEKVPAVALDFFPNNDNTSISLIHRGGETLNLSGAQLKVVYRGDPTSYDETSKFNLTNSSGSSAPLSPSVPALYSIGDNLSFTSANSTKIDQVQLIWPGTGGAVLLGAWFPNSSSGENPPAAVTGAVPITFPYPSEGPTRAQPTQTPPVPWVYFIANITAINGTLPINFTDLTENEGSYKRSWNLGKGQNVTNQINPITYYDYQLPTEWPYIKNYTVTLTLTNGTDPTRYSLSRPDYISVYQSPTAGFTANISPLEGNSGMNVIFTNTTTGYVTSLAWDFDDGTTSPYANPGHIFNSSPSILSNYTVKLTAHVNLRESHESTISTQTIKVHPQVIASFTATPITGPAPLNVSFDGSPSKGDGLTYNWTFGDGATSTSQNPIHPYTTAGNYTVNLTVSNTLPGPNTSSRTMNITVTSAPLSPPVANFTATPINGTKPLNVTFTDTSTNAPTSWFWDFGDGNTSFQQNPVHTYTQFGSYTVTLTAGNAAGNNTSAPQTILVYSNQDTVRVNAGGGSYTDCLGNVWLADQVYTPGGWGYSPAGAPLYSVNGSIGNTSDPTLYQTSRWSSSSTVDYQFNVPNKDYTVQLKFAETDTNIAPGNPRKFHVDVNGYRVASNFNVYGIVGANTATDLYRTVTVTNNLIHIVLTGTTGQPMIAAIGIAPASTWVTPNFTANRTASNAPLPVQFTDTSTGNVTKRYWDFGDGSNSTQQNPAHTYTTAGTYTVMLTAGNANQSSTVVKQQYITVGRTLNADFTANTTSGIAPLMVGFTDNSTGDGISNWTWNFGDTTTATTRNATHLYTTPGIYNVTLTVSNLYGSASTTKTRYITVHSLNPNFTANKTIGNTPLPVQFTDTTTSDLSINTWNWNFGDTTTATTQNPVHTYTAAGNYTVTLTVITTTGFTNTTTKNVYITVLQPLVPNFTADRTAGNGQVPVQFTDTTTGYQINNWKWTLGDGNTSTSQNPQHTYTTPGTYTVTLTAGNAYGNGTVTKTGYITVYPPLVAAFGGAPRLGNAPLNVSFVDQSTGFTISGWNWTFGDGATSISQNPQHTYTTAGNFTVNLTITNAYGTASVSQPAFVTVLPQLVANFTVNRTAGNAQLPVQFTDTSTGSVINGWSWDFGDNTTASSRNPQHIYTTAGTYTVTLTASNSYGNATITRTGLITVLHPLVAAFTGTPTVGNGQVNVQFTDQSTGDGISNWTWTFGDTTNATTQNQAHLYTTNGSYNVTLTINNAYGSSTVTKTRYITVYPPLVAAFTATPTSGMAPLQVDFTDTSTGYNIIGWTWDFGDNSTASNQNPSHTYALPGTYTASLVVTNPTGQSAPATRTITVTVPPTPIPAGGGINGTIYNDQDGNGVANTGDPKLAGWTINLLQNGAIIATTTSDTFGAYAFYSLDKGKYNVMVVLPVGWQGTNPAGGISPQIHINGANDQFPITDFWNYYKPVTTGGNIILNAVKPGYLVKDGYLQFTSTGSDSNIGVTIGGQIVHFNNGDIVKIVVSNTEIGIIYIANGQISGMQLQNAAVYINNNLTRTGQITAIDTHGGYSNLISTLTVTVPSKDAWVSFKVNDVEKLSSQDYSKVINLYNISAGSNNVLNLNLGVNAYIDASAGSYQLLP